MTILERLGIIIMLYGVAMHTWHDLATLFLANMLMLGGGVLLLAGGYITRWLMRMWPEARWE